MSEQLAKVYEPKIIEQQANQIWASGSYFHAQPGGDHEKTYTIVIPPPNVTAPLHLGHALNNTLQDILIRLRRMQNFNTLWMPGTDHAGIATQTVVEKRILSEEGKKRTDFKREEFVARVQAWKDEYEACIIGQLKAMGCSCDWQRTRFTMDEVCAKAVRAAFFKLFEDGLIYRGKRLVNWDPATQTVLADDEVEHETIQGHFWYMRYPLTEPVKIGSEQIESVTVATTRPETMLGDTAVAMNPADLRAKYLVGKIIRLPIVGRIIPIIADEHVVLPNPNSEDEKARFSTGFLKVTPAHDPDDWEIGQRHNLDVINIMAPDGSISDKFGWTDAGQPEAQALLGMDRFEAREAVVEWFRQEGLLEEIRPYSHEVGHSYRSHVPIEPYLSDQWYIAVKKPISSLVARDSSLAENLIEGTDVPVNSLAGLALKPLLDGRLRFIPERYAKTYQTWLENLRDWPISRQLWWGHQIPVWSKTGRHENRCKYGTFSIVSETEQGTVTYACVRPGFEKLEKTMETEDWVRDTDVLDTWFSSALWPFSTLGWPDDKPELKTFYPGDVLCTAREIITLWVSRMVMMGQYCVGDIPFSDVYIHAMIQDGEGRKMSKSLGNGIDPLVAIDSHGADAMRFTLASMTTDTQDIRMPVSQMTLPDGREANTSPKFDLGRNFCNKLWNASRFAMMNLEGTDPAMFDAGKMDITDRWILSRLAKTASEVTKALENFKFSEPLSLLYKFFWNDFCDWYLEWAKPRMQNQQQKPTAQNVLAFVLDQSLRLLHPFIPFITEGIFQKLNEITPDRSLHGLAEAKKADALVIAAWPALPESLIDETIEQEIEIIQNVVRSVRDIRNQYNLTSSLVVSANADEKIAILLNSQADLICSSAGAKSFNAGADIQKPANAATAIVEQMQIYVHDVIDVEAEKQKLLKQKQEIEKSIQASQARLSNADFVNKAKPQVVAQAREKLALLTEQMETINKHLAELEQSNKN
jgi:valyl-tRNA synthetase